MARAPTPQHTESMRASPLTFSCLWLKHWDRNTSFMSSPVAYKVGLYQQQETGGEGPLVGFRRAVPVFFLAWGSVK